MAGKNSYTFSHVLKNGFHGDKSANGGNVLTRAVLAELPEFDGPKVVYCAGCLLGRERLDWAEAERKCRETRCIGEWMP